MRCLWALFKWPRRQKLEEEERQLPLDTLDRVTLLQSWDRSWDGEAHNRNSPSSLQGRYVRFGIGGAGNMRKSGFLFLDVDQPVSLPAVNLTDMSRVDRVISHNGREMIATAR